MIGYFAVNDQILAQEKGENILSESVGCTREDNHTSIRRLKITESARPTLRVGK